MVRGEPRRAAVGPLSRASGTSDRAVSVSNLLSNRHWELDQFPAVGTQRTLFRSAQILGSTPHPVWTPPIGGSPRRNPSKATLVERNEPVLCEKAVTALRGGRI